MFRRTRYQQGSLILEERKRGSAVWVYRWWEKDINGKPVRRKLQLGNLERYPSEAVAQAAADALRLTINNPSTRRNLRLTTVDILWEHYCREELPLKEMSTQDAYSVYAKNWILPRWGNVLLEEIKTVEVERWLRSANVADGTKAKIKCVMSALFSHAVRWEFSGHNPISSGIPVGAGGKRGPSTGVRVSAKRQEAPLVLSPEQVKLGLAKLEFRDQLLVFLDGALGTRRGELGALRWSDCNFDNMSFSVQHSYYWRRGGHLKSTKTEASAKVLPMHPALKDVLLEWKLQNEYNRPGDFVFPSHRHKGKKPLDLAAVLQRKIQPAFAAIGITGVGWHTFRHTVGTMLAEMGEHQLTIRDYLLTAICMSRTSISKQHRNGSAWRRASWWMPSCRAVCYRRANQLSFNSWCWRVHSEMQECAAGEVLRRLIGPKRTQIFSWVYCKCLKNMAGTTGLEPAASAVTAAP